ncbi:MAG: hypothetical protein ACRD88_06865 [Terriglobia bacterium]
MKRSRWFQMGFLLALLVTMLGEPLWPQLPPQRRPPGNRLPPFGTQEPVPPNRPSITRRMLRASFEQLQKEVAELAEMSAALQEEVNQSNEDVFPLSAVKKAEEIEKLAKKIQGRIKNL